MIEKRPLVLIVYPYIPHYRVPVFKELLSRNGMFDYRIIYSKNSIDKSIKSLSSGFFGDQGEITPGREIFGRFFIQWMPLRYIFFRRPIAVVFLANPYFITTWIYALLFRLTGSNVLFWTHGWLGLEKGLKALIRNIFYSISTKLLLYGERAKEVGRLSGFRVEKLSVVFNSLDFEQQKDCYNTIHENKSFHRSILEATLKYNGRYFVCVSRVTKKCRLDLAIFALSIIRDKFGIDYGLVIVGGGGELDELRILARQMGVTLICAGETYEEIEVGRYIYFARATVSPGKAGLTVMHSLAYGTPVISHADWTQQMPEFEAILDGYNGSHFTSGDSGSLADAMMYWIRKERDIDERLRCREKIFGFYNPRAQADLLEISLKE